MLTGILISAVLIGLCAQGGTAWLLIFVALVPWLRTLDASPTLTRTLLAAYAMSIAYTAAAFAWFGIAIGSYTQVGAATGLIVLLIGAPLFQPQLLVFAVVRHVAGRRHGPFMRALAGASAWVAAEWLIPKMLGDTYGQGLYPSRLLRQAADVGGTAGLTFMLLLANEGVAAALARRSNTPSIPPSNGQSHGRLAQAQIRAMVPPLAIAALVPALLSAYGFIALSATPAPTGKPLRMGLIQSNIKDYEHQRQEKGAYAVVHEVLNTHFAMTYDAVVRQHADAVLWSETAYPTTFGHPKSQAGAEFDHDILSIVHSAGVPFVFGTYDLDAAGEYNAAAFVEPKQGLLGFYRKTRLFPLTEYVPAWLDGPLFKRLLPWTGSWKPGTGARVFPLRLADGREIPVLPLICLDDVDTSLSIDGARLGAQAILTMSNDSWFTDHPQGAELHQAAAAFRSIETRLPQFRVTTNGYSALIDATGTVVAGARMGEQTLVMGATAVQPPPRTLVVAWGDWVGIAGAALLALLALMALFPSLHLHGEEAAAATAVIFPIRVTVLPPAARVASGALRVLARGALLCMGVAMLFNDNLRTNTLAQIRTFTAVFLVPEAAAWFVLLAFAARASIENGMLVLTRGAHRLELAVQDIMSVEPWRLPIPGPGVSLRLTSGEHWSYGLALTNPNALARALTAANGVPWQGHQPSRRMAYIQTLLAIRRGRLDEPWAKFVLLPLLLALPAFRLHQYIAYGSSFGEYYTFGLKAYVTTFFLWWAAWAIGVVLSAAALRTLIEAGSLLTVLVRPEQALDARRLLERLGLLALYLGLPAWLLMRALGN